MATTNATQAAKVAEEARANREREAQNRRELGEESRQNRAREAENTRSNRASEGIRRVGNVLAGLGTAGQIANVGLQAVSGIMNARSNAVKAGAAKQQAEKAKNYNDPFWYNLNKQLMEDTCKVNFHNPLGRYAWTGWGNLEEGTSFGISFDTAVPGVCAIHWVPCLNMSSTTGIDDDINSVAKTVYTKIRKGQTSTAPYEPADLMMYLLAADSVYSLIGAAARLYSLAGEAKIENWYYPNGLLAAFKINQADLMANITDYRGRLNRLIVKANKLAIPGMTYYDRHAWMNTGIFKDGDTHRSQVYMYIQDQYYVYADNYSMLWGAKVDYSTMGALLDCIERAINAMLNSSDAQNIAGDLIRALGEDKMYTVQLIAEDFHIESYYNEEVLSQFENASLFGYLGTNHDIDNKTNLIDDHTAYVAMTQQQVGSTSSPGGIYTVIMQGLASTPYSSVATVRPSVQSFISSVPTAVVYTNTEEQVDANITPASQMFTKTILNFHWDKPSLDDVMVASRCSTTATMVSVLSASGSVIGYYKQLQTCGTEITTHVTIVSAPSRVTQQPVISDMWDGKIAGSYTSILEVENIFAASRYNSFDWAPRLRAVGVTLQDANDEWEFDAFAISDSLDFANFAILDEAILANMHVTAALSEFGITALPEDEWK